MLEVLMKLLVCQGRLVVPALLIVLSTDCITDIIVVSEEVAGICLLRPYYFLPVLQ